MSTVDVDYQWRGDFDNAEVNALHAEGFGHRILDDDSQTIRRSERASIRPRSSRFGPRPTPKRLANSTNGIEILSFGTSELAVETTNSPLS